MEGTKPLDYESLSNYVLANKFPVLVKDILQYLTVKDLNSCARVCKLWKKLVDEVKPKRDQIGVFMETVRSKKRVCELFDKFRDSIQRAWSEPQSSILFLSSPLYDDSNLYLRHVTEQAPLRSKRMAVDKSLYATLRDFFPPRCAPLIVVTPGVIGSECGTLQVREVEDGRAMSGVTFPAVEGLTVHPFNIDWLAEDVGEEEFSIPTLPPDVKMILFLFNNDIDESVTRRLRETLPGVVIAGGFADNFIHSLDPHGDEQLLNILPCVAFCGERVAARSIILDPYVKKRSEVEAKLRQLKNCELDERCSVAFHIACCGRGAHHYGGEKNLESCVFRKLFPHTPLVGFFGSGEVGFDSLSESHVELKTAPVENIHMGFTSVFCLLSFK